MFAGGKLLLPLCDEEMKNQRAQLPLDTEWKEQRDELGTSKCDSATGDSCWAGREASLELPALIPTRVLPCPRPSP